MKIEIEKVFCDPKLQPRNELNADAIQQYSQDMLNGDIFPPVDVMEISGKYHLISGWHRMFAAKRSKLETIEANVTQGDYDDALWQAAGTNVEHDKSGSRRKNADKQKAVKMALEVKATKNGQVNFSEIARHVGVGDRMVRDWYKKLYPDSENGHNGGKTAIVPTFTNGTPLPPPPDPTPEAAPNIHERMASRRLETFWAEQNEEIKEIQEEIKTVKQSKLNKTNDNIEWAGWSWNPVTGCLHDCSYCYARDIANRFYPEGFQPSFHPDRLDAPDNTNAPVAPRFYGDIGYKNIFTCSMADLFGKWVPEDWINSVLESIRRNPQWTFLLLSKFPVRMAEFEYPDNVWLGASVDYQHTVKRAESAFTKIKASGFNGVCWLSCEPMMENLQFNSLEMFDWAVMGGASSSTKTPEFSPPFDWIVNLYNQARKANCKIYQKTNLIPNMSNTQRVREYPSEK